MKSTRGLRRSLAALPAHPQATRLIARAMARGTFADALHMLRTTGLQPDRRNEKVLSRKYNFVCICIPKVASHSLTVALSNVDADIETFNLSIDELFAARPEAARYFVFSFVRHPFTRALSLYQELFLAREVYAAGYHAHQDQTTRCFLDPVAGRSFRLARPAAVAARPERKDEKRRRMVHRHYGLGRVRNFDDYCVWLNTFFAADAFADRHFLSQHAHTRICGDRTPNFIGRVENLDADLSVVAERVGMPKPVVPTLNTMAGWHAAPAALAEARAAASASLTDRNKALLRRRYARDFALGNYDRVGAAARGGA